MSKKAAGAAALACGNSACGKALAPPLLQCSKCKGEAYCCKACQVGDPAAAATHRAPSMAPAAPPGKPRWSMAPAAPPGKPLCSVSRAASNLTLVRVKIDAEARQT